jgi:hypothetical protein
METPLTGDLALSGILALWLGSTNSNFTRRLVVKVRQINLKGFCGRIKNLPRMVVRLS